MTARLLLVRHGAHDLLGRILCGRGSIVALNAEGEAQAERVGKILCREHPTELYASPTHRAWQTAKIIGTRCELAPQPCAALDELDMGEWTGLAFDKLAQDPAWSRWNTARLHHAPPGGETMIEAQTRMAVWIRAIGTQHDGRVVVGISHADVIKAACCHALGLSVDFHHRFDIDPVSITAFEVSAWGVRLTRLNSV